MSLKVIEVYIHELNYRFTLRIFSVLYFCEQAILSFEQMVTNDLYFSDVSCISAVPHSDHHSSVGHIRVQRRHSNVFENFTLQRPDTDTKVKIELEKSLSQEGTKGELEKSLSEKRKSIILTFYMYHPRVLLSSLRTFIIVPLTNSGSACHWRLCL